jgi:hypothetical protein
LAFVVIFKEMAQGMPVSKAFLHSNALKEYIGAPAKPVPPDYQEYLEIGIFEDPAESYCLEVQLADDELAEWLNPEVRDLDPQYELPLNIFPEQISIREGSQWKVAFESFAVDVSKQKEIILTTTEATEAFVLFPQLNTNIYHSKKTTSSK